MSTGALPACMYVRGFQILELQTAVSCHVDPLEEQSVLLATEPSLQPHIKVLKGF